MVCWDFPKRNTPVVPSEGWKVERKFPKQSIMILEEMQEIFRKLGEKLTIGGLFAKI